LLPRVDDLALVPVLRLSGTRRIEILSDVCNFRRDCAVVSAEVRFRLRRTGRLLRAGSVRSSCFDILRACASTLLVEKRLSVTSNDRLNKKEKRRRGTGRAAGGNAGEIFCFKSPSSTKRRIFNTLF
jgi:hypothetical protein